MTYFFDTSALIKNYIDEIGSEKVIAILENAEAVFVSEIYVIESLSTIRRILEENKIAKKEYEYLKQEIKSDNKYFSIVDIENVYDRAEILIDKYQLKSLDSIQLGSMILLKDQIDFFVCCDTKLIKAAEQEKIETINPIIESAQ